MTQRQPMTIEGKEKLDSELRELVQVVRPQVIKAIEEARAHGDLSENADYSAAKEKQALVEARIGQLQAQLVNAEVVDISKIKSDKILFGATVKLFDVDSEKTVTYKIVGENEANVNEGKISVFSPLGRQLIGKMSGDEVRIQGKSLRTYEIKSFKFE